MPVAKVWTLKNATVPKSAMVSMIANSAPPAIAGRAIGKATRQNACIGERPSVRATRNALPDCCRNEARARR